MQNDDIIVKTFYMQMALCLWWLWHLSLFVSSFAFACFCAGMKQQNDHGTQYRSAIYTSSPTQQELALKSKVVFQQVWYNGYNTHIYIIRLDYDS